MSSRHIAPRPDIHRSKSVGVNSKVNKDGYLDTSDEICEGNSIEAEAGEHTPYNPESNKDSPRKARPPVEKSQSKQTGCGVYLGFLGFVVIVMLAFFAYKVLPHSEKKCAYSQLRERYQKQDKKLWHTLSVNTENILNERCTNPAVYLFLHQGSKDMQALVKNIAADTAECFGGQLVEMSENDFTTDDYGYAIDKFKEKIKDRHVALIVHLNKIPVEAARALHFICDTHTPIAEGVVIYLTLVTPSSVGKPKENAVNTLRNLWSSKLEDNVLDPLITRVTDEVIALKSD